MRGATWSHSRGIGEALANKLDRDTDREQESEGECESSEKELGNPRAGSVEDFGTRCIVPPRGMHPRPPQINRSLL